MAAPRYEARRDAGEIDSLQARTTHNCRDDCSTDGFKETGRSGDDFLLGSSPDEPFDSAEIFQLTDPIFDPSSRFPLATSRDFFLVPSPCPGADRRPNQRDSSPPREAWAMTLMVSYLMARCAPRRCQLLMPELHLPTRADRGILHVPRRQAHGRTPRSSRCETGTPVATSCSASKSRKKGAVSAINWHPAPRATLTPQGGLPWTSSPIRPPLS
jgi:hypothetical protein